MYTASCIDPQVGLMSVGIDPKMFPDVERTARSISGVTSQKSMVSSQACYKNVKDNESVHQVRSAIRSNIGLNPINLNIRAILDNILKTLQEKHLVHNNYG